ncbi:uncharacterized protein [Diadema setosum]|uniref:uncharacterized protein n=1 Tax=Diadema setosum TaxID=31175 RepID=UPI003B3AAFCE
MSAEFVVPAEKRVAVVENERRIEQTFDVLLRCSQPGESGEDDAGDSGCIHIVSCDDADATVWVQIEGDKENIEKAKEYTLSLCSDNLHQERLSPRLLDMLDAQIPHLEYQSGAVIERASPEHLVLRGSDENIVRAQSLITSLSEARQLAKKGVSENLVAHSAVAPLDSYVDSRVPRSAPRRDFSDSVGRSNTDEPDGLLHRATDSSHRRLLRREGGAELQEKAMPTEDSPAPPRDTPQDSVQDTIALMQKLGYSLESVEQVLAQVGDQASSNEVLQRLLSQTPSKVAEEDEEEHSAGEEAEVARSPVSRDASDGPIHLDDKDEDPYRPVIIDGSNVAMSYGNKNVFACKGIETVVLWFLNRKHKVIYVFVPSWRKEQSKPETPIQDQEVLIKLEKARILVWTPSRRVKGRRMVCYDDRYILNLAVELDGIVVSNDTFRDLSGEKPEYQKVVEERLLMYTFAGNKFMPPDDPLGRHGPSLENFLRKTPAKPTHQMQPCPYGKKCTYGNKCKYSHPERTRSHRPTSEVLMEKDRLRKEQQVRDELQARAMEQSHMPWKENGVLSGSGTELLGSLPTDSTPLHEGATTLPMMNPPRHTSGTKTVPLMGSQRSSTASRPPGREDAARFRPSPSHHQTNGMAMPQPLSSMPTQWSNQRIPAYHPRQPAEQLTNRAMTAPLPHYQSYLNHPPQQKMRTAPLPSHPSHDYYSHQAIGPSKRISLPSNKHSLPQQLMLMSLQDSKNHPVGYEEERHHSYPTSNPYRWTQPPPRPAISGDFNTQAAVSMAGEDEGYFSPRAAHPQSQPKSFMYPSSSPSPASSPSSVWGPALLPGGGNSGGLGLGPSSLGLGPSHQGRGGLLQSTGPLQTSEAARSRAWMGSELGQEQLLSSIFPRVPDEDPSGLSDRSWNEFQVRP